MATTAVHVTVVVNLGGEAEGISVVYITRGGHLRECVFVDVWCRTF